MDLAARLQNRVSNRDRQQLWEAQCRVFQNALAAMRQLSPAGYARDRGRIIEVEGIWSATRCAEVRRVLTAAPCYVWVLSAVRAWIQNPVEPLPALELGNPIEVPWKGPLPVFRLDAAPDIEGRLTTDTVFFNADGTSLCPTHLSDPVAREAWTADLGRALEALAKYQPDFAELYPQFVQYHVALDVGANAESSYGVSITSRDAPGVIGFSPMLPLALVGTLVHECRHNILYAVQEFDPLVLDGGATVTSPWRSDPRPLGGLLHGAFVFDGICRLYSRVTNDSGLSDQNRRAAAKQFRQQADNLAEAVTTLKTATEFTVLGRQLVVALEEAVPQHRETARKTMQNT